MEAGRLVRGQEEAGGPQATGAQELLGDESRHTGLDGGAGQAGSLSGCSRRLCGGGREGAA
eukprot:2282663-Prymnesium_polylepis.1